MTKELYLRIDQALEYLHAKNPYRPKVGIILGSGLSGVADQFPGDEIPYSHIPGLPVSTVAGHRGVMKIGPQVMVMVGRFHFYEGWTMGETAMPLFLMKGLGVEKVILTNAAGGIAPELNPGDLCLISDHINFLGTNPFMGPSDPKWGQRFFDLSEVYSRKLRQGAQKAHKSLWPGKPALGEGVYAAMTGPSYETPAEIHMLHILGASLVGMSTVPEAIAARHLGLEVLGISCVTNKAAGISLAPLDHLEVVEVGKKVEKDMASLLLLITKDLTNPVPPPVTTL